MQFQNVMDETLFIYMKYSDACLTQNLCTLQYSTYWTTVLQKKTNQTYMVVVL